MRSILNDLRSQYKAAVGLDKELKDEIIEDLHATAKDGKSSLNANRYVEAAGADLVESFVINLGLKFARFKVLDDYEIYGWDDDE